MARALKTFATLNPRSVEKAQPKTNQFTLDLSGLPLTEEHLASIRQEAVKSAMAATARILGRAVPDVGQIMDGFGTFSTFSTFSTFGSGAAGGLPIVGLPDSVGNIIDRVVNPG